MREEKYIEKKREKREEIGERRMGLSPIGETLTKGKAIYHFLSPIGPSTPPPPHSLGPTIPMGP